MFYLAQHAQTIGAMFNVEPTDLVMGMFRLHFTKPITCIDRLPS